MLVGLSGRTVAVPPRAAAAATSGLLKQGNIITLRPELLSWNVHERTSRRTVLAQKIAVATRKTQDNRTVVTNGSRATKLRPL